MEEDKKSKKKHKKSRDEGAESKKHHKEEDAPKVDDDEDSKKKDKPRRKKSTKARADENEPPTATITIVERSEPYVPKAPKQPVTDVIQLLKEKEMRYKISVNRGNANQHWQPPISKVYKDNYGFGVHAYSPMIDYLNDKDIGRNPERKVHLPTLEERCMKKFHSSNPVYGYDNHDIDYFIDKGEKIRTAIRQNDAAGGSNSLTRTHTNWSMTRKWVQMVKDSHVIDHRADQNLTSLRARSASPARARSDSMSRQIRPRQSITPSRTIENDYEARDMMRYNTMSRHNELLDLEDRVNDLTDRSSARNQLLDSLHHLNNELSTSSNIRAMADYNRYARSTPVYNSPDIQQLRSDINSGRLAAPRTYKNPDHIDSVRMMPEIPKEVRPPKVRTIDPNEQTISNTYANCIDRANEKVCRTPELREIKYRSHFANIYKDPTKNPYAEPSKTQLNIEHMADTLAAGGRMVRRYDVDEELPVYIEKKDPSFEKDIEDRHNPIHEKVPSNSMRVRRADLNARSRNTLLGY